MAMAVRFKATLRCRCHRRSRCEPIFWPKPPTALSQLLSRLFMVLCCSPNPLTWLPIALLNFWPNYFYVLLNFWSDYPRLLLNFWPTTHCFSQLLTHYPLFPSTFDLIIHHFLIFGPITHCTCTKAGKANHHLMQRISLYVELKMILNILNVRRN